MTSHHVRPYTAMPLPCLCRGQPHPCLAMPLSKLAMITSLMGMAAMHCHLLCERSSPSRAMMSPTTPLPLTNPSHLHSPYRTSPSSSSHGRASNSRHRGSTPPPSRHRRGHDVIIRAIRLLQRRALPFPYDVIHTTVFHLYPRRGATMSPLSHRCTTSAPPPWSPRPCLFCLPS